MINSLNIIAATVGICAGLLTIISFFREKIKHKILIFILCSVLSFMVVLTSYILNEKRHNAEIVAIKNEELIKDAIITSNKGYTTPIGSAGEYIGMLSQIAGFYKRHKDLYSYEYETYSKELSYWQDYLKSVREAGKDTRYNDTNDLKGIVEAGRNNIYKISQNGKDNKY